MFSFFITLIVVRFLSFIFFNHLSLFISLIFFLLSSISSINLCIILNLGFCFTEVVVVGGCVFGWNCNWNILDCQIYNIILKLIFFILPYFLFIKFTSIYHKYILKEVASPPTLLFCVISVQPHLLYPTADIMSSEVNVNLINRSYSLWGGWGGLLGIILKRAQTWFNCNLRFELEYL